MKRANASNNTDAQACKKTRQLIFDKSCTFSTIFFQGKISLADHFAAARDKHELAHPQIELQRSSCILQLRKKYQELLAKFMQQMPEPKMSFNRWIIESHLHETWDPLLPSSAKNTELSSTVLVREILDDIPIKCKLFPKSLEEAHRNLDDYAKSSLELITKSVPHAATIAQEHVTIIVQQMNDIQQWCKSNTSTDAAVEKLKHTKANFGKHLQQKMEPCAKLLCKELFTASHEMIEKLQQLIVEKDALEIDVARGSNVKLVWRQVSVSIGLMHYEKLQMLHEASKSKTNFHASLFSMLLRYESAMGDDFSSGLHAAITPSTFQYLYDYFHVQMECFASPLNCFYSHYCSAFPDTDIPFGSCGSFFDFEPTTGSFEANPPFVEELMLQMVTHMESLLAKANESNNRLSFIVFVPNWTDAGSVIAMQKSLYRTNDIVLPAYEHSYIPGNQHVKSHQAKYKAVHETRVFVLQSIEAAKKYPASDHIMQKLLSLAEK